MTNLINQNNPTQDIVLYQSKDGKISLNVNVLNETVWVTQKDMTLLFEKDQSVIARHIANIFKEGELDKKSNMQKMHIANSDKPVLIYSLDVIISVGYRVKSQRGTQFRIWATNVLKKYLMNGFAINEARIKQIEDKIDKLSTDIKSELREEFRAEFQEINRHLLAIANRPINITNQISLASNQLEEKIINLLDELIIKIKADNNPSKESQKLQSELEQAKENLSTKSKSRETKNQIVEFFTNLGDEKSKLHKAAKGAGITKKFINELVKLGIKLKHILC